MPVSDNVAEAYRGFTTDVDAMQNEWPVPTFVDDPLRSTATGFSADDFLAEYILFRAYRAFEYFVETVAIQYCLGECTITGTPVESHIRPRDTQHARDLLRATAKWIEWGDPNTLIKISENVFRDGFPIKKAVTGHLSMLTDIRKVRNYIAHASSEAERKYSNVVTGARKTAPLIMPTCGQFLRMRGKEKMNIYLERYLECLAQVASEIVEAP
jgi:hypothetical protein